MSDKDKAPERVFLRACHPDSPNANCSWDVDREREGSIAYVPESALATVRQEAREEAIKISCSECATGDVPTFNSDLRWYYHFTGSEPFGCSASKLRIAALDRAADSGEGENDG